MSRSFPECLETPTGALAAAQATLLATCDELTQVRAQIALELAEHERLRGELKLRDAALDVGTSHFMIVDAQHPDTPIVYVNRVLAHEHGYEPRELIGKNYKILKFVEPDAQDVEKFLQGIRVGQPVRAEGEVVRRDGSTFWAGFTTTPIKDKDGTVTHYVTVGADITVRREAERKRTELQQQLYSEMRERERMAIELRLAQKLESVGRLAAGLAHEINTPIQYVGDSVYFLRSAFADLAKLFYAYRDATLNRDVSTLTAPTLAALQAIEQEIDFDFLQIEVPKAFERTLEGTQRVAGIVRAMKEFAHPDGNEQSPSDINRALETTLTVARNEYKYDASVKTTFGTIPDVTCNIGELNQVFLNLIINAAHAIQDSVHDAASGCISIQTRLTGTAVEVVIGDNGCGIPPENIEKIFDPFFTTKAVGRGTGQGLPIARSIVVDKHGGQIEVESEVGKGTRFILRLPIAGRAAAKAAA